VLPTSSTSSATPQATTSSALFISHTKCEFLQQTTIYSSSAVQDNIISAQLIYTNLIIFVNRSKIFSLSSVKWRLKMASLNSNKNSAIYITPCDSSFQLFPPPPPSPPPLFPPSVCFYTDQMHTSPPLGAPPHSTGWGGEASSSSIQAGVLGRHGDVVPAHLWQAIFITTQLARPDSLQPVYTQPGDQLYILYLTDCLWWPTRAVGKSFKTYYWLLC